MKGSNDGGNGNDGNGNDGGNGNDDRCWDAHGQKRRPDTARDAM